MELEKFLIAASDGCPLFMLRATGSDKSGPVVLLGHGPSVHSRLLMPCIEAFVTAGATVWAGDLRGHGGSISDRAPKAHLDAATGWNALVSDMAQFADLAFRNVPLARRLLVGGGLSGHVMLDMLAQHGAVARHLVLAGPTPPQRGVSKVLQGFLRVRQLTRPVDAPDPQFLHHIYGFLRAHLPVKAELADTISPHPDRVARVLADPAGFPTPTLGYWQAVLTGIQGSWSDKTGLNSLPEDLRVLVLTGPEDPQTRGGKLLGKVIDSFKARGVTDVSAVLLDGVRANILIDAETVPVVAKTLGWFEDGVAQIRELRALDSPLVPYQPAMDSLQMSAPSPTLNLPQLMELCYSAVRDDARWIEMVYCLCLAAEAGGEDLDSVMDALHPHWQRAFELREELRWASGMGQIYTDLIDRLDIGVAVLDADLRLRHANPAFKRAMIRLLGGTEDKLSRMTADLLARQPQSAARSQTKTGGSETPILFDGRVIGVSFIPGGMMEQTARANPLGRLLVVRDPTEQPGSLSYRANLLMLAYGLTEKESHVALLLAEGQSTQEAAEVLTVSEHTLRSHVKQVFDKMQISRRGELSQRILSGPLGWMTAPDTALDLTRDVTTRAKGSLQRTAHSEGPAFERDRP